MYIKILIYLFFLIGAISDTLALSKTKLIEEKDVFKNGESLVSYAFYYEDKQSQLDLEGFLKIPDNNLTASKENTLSFAFSSSSYWIRFNLENRGMSSRNLVFNLRYPLIDVLDYSLVYADGRRHTYHSGDTQNFESRWLSQRNFAFPVPMNPGEKIQIVLKVRSASSLTLPVELWEREALVERENNGKILLALYFGCMLGVLFYNGFIFLSTRSKSYFFYTGFVLASILFYLAWSGIGTLYLWTDSQYLTQRSWAISGMLMTITGTCFQYLFFGIKKSRLDKLYQAMILLSIVSTIVVAVIDINLAQKYAFAVGAFFCFYLFIVALILSAKKNRQAIFFTIAWSTFILFIVLGAAASVGGISFGPLGPVLVANGSQIGSALEAILLSLGLADRINVMKRKELVQSKKIISNLSKIEILKERLSSILQSTKHMAESMEQISALKEVAGQIKSKLNYLNVEEILYFEKVKNERKPNHPMILEGGSKPLVETKFPDKFYHEIKLEKNQIFAPVFWKDSEFGIFSITISYLDQEILQEDLWFLETLLQSLALTLQNIVYQDNLHELVNEKTRDVRMMLSTIRQGIFTLDSQKKEISKEYSKHLETIFGKENLSGKKFSDILFSDAKTGIDRIRQMETVIDACIGEDLLVFEANSSLLITEYTRVIGEDERYYEVDWSPVCNDKEVIEKILVTVRDVTNLKNLEKNNQMQQEEHAKTMELLDLKPHRFDRFLKNSFSFIREAYELCDSQSTYNEKVLHDLFIITHTLKGEMRTCNFSSLCDKVHAIEEKIGLIKSNAGVYKKCLAEIAEDYEVVELILLEYRRINEFVLGRRADKQTFIFDTETVQYFEQQLSFISELDSVELMKVIVAEVFKYFNQATGRSVMSLIEDVTGIAKVTARQLNKPFPEIHMDIDESIVLPETYVEAFEHSLTHILKNSVGHGIEEPSERIDKGKSEKGNITITLQKVEDEILLTISDDGQGLDIEKIYQKALANQIVGKEDHLPTQEKAELIFSEGLSTVSNVTEISGRGVGMGACKQFITNIGGNISVVLKEDPSEKDSKQPFEFQITLPNSA